MFDQLPLSSSRLAIGTAQFGQEYGLSSKSSPTRKEIIEILQLAKENSVQLLDTAPSYNCSEEILGSSGIIEDFKIVTKFSKANYKLDPLENKNRIIDKFRESLDLLKVENIYGILIHQAEDLDIDNGRFVRDLVNDFRKDGRVSKIGISVYSANQIERVLDIFKPDIIQLPVSIFDQRLLVSGHIEQLSKMGIEIHARSVFLQGLLLKDLNYLKKYFPDHFSIVKKALTFSKSFGCSIEQMASSFVNSIDEIDNLLVGFRSPQQLRSFLEMPFRRIDLSDCECLSVTRNDLIDPRQWS